MNDEQQQIPLYIQYIHLCYVVDIYGKEIRTALPFAHFVLLWCDVAMCMVMLP